MLVVLIYELLVLSQEPATNKKSGNLCQSVKKKKGLLLTTMYCNTLLYQIFDFFYLELKLNILKSFVVVSAVIISSV